METYVAKDQIQEKLSPFMQQLIAPQCYFGKKCCSLRLGEDV